MVTAINHKFYATEGLKLFFGKDALGLLLFVYQDADFEAQGYGEQG